MPTRPGPGGPRSDEERLRALAEPGGLAGAARGARNAAPATLAGGKSRNDLRLLCGNSGLSDYQKMGVCLVLPEGENVAAH